MFEDSRAYYIRLAGTRNVKLRAVDEEYGLHFAYLPERLDWPQIQVSRMLVNWRIQVCDAWNSTCAYWCYPGVWDDTFKFAIDRLRSWGGDPAGEPTGHISAHDRRATARFWRRRPGQLLAPEDAPWLQPGWKSG